MAAMSAPPSKPTPPVAGGGVVVDVAGGDVAGSGGVGEGDERANAGGVAEDLVLLELDEDVVAAEPRDVLL